MWDAEQATAPKRTALNAESRSSARNLLTFPYQPAMIGRPDRTLCITILLTVFALLCAPDRAHAQHPTAVTSILNGESPPDTTLEVNYNGSLLAPGTFDPMAPNDSIPAIGGGSRLMWYPAKSAFRAGEISGSQWDASNIGEHSVALGHDTKASAIYSTAMGDATTASGPDATAMGEETIAEARQSAAMGLATTAGATNSLSVGTCNSSGTSNDGSLFVVGNGSHDIFDGCTSRDDAFVVDDAGNATASSHDTFSDRRLKSSVEPLGNGTMAKLTELRPVRYEFDDQQAHPSGKQIGLIAQDVQKEFPALVSEGAGGYLSLAYPKLTAVLLQGLQEQEAAIDSLKKRVRQVENLQKRIARLEARSHSDSIIAGVPGGQLLLGLLLGGLFGAGLFWRRRG